MLVPDRTTNVFGRSPFVMVTAGPAPIVTLSTAVAAVTSPPRLVESKVTKRPTATVRQQPGRRSEEHTSELQSRSDIVCRLLLDKKSVAFRVDRSPARKRPAEFRVRVPDDVVERPGQATVVRDRGPDLLHGVVDEVHVLASDGQD